MVLGALVYLVRRFSFIIIQRDQDADSWVLRIRTGRAIAIGISYGRFYRPYGRRLVLRVLESFLYGYRMQLFLLCVWL
jgi:hypothetical protein